MAKRSAPRPGSRPRVAIQNEEGQGRRSQGGPRSLKRPVPTADTSTLPLFAAVMRQQSAADDLAIVQERPTHLSTGLPSVDRAMRGGFPVGGLTLVAARARVGATSMLMGATLASLKRGERVAYFSERLKQEQLRGRFVVLESRVNGYRFRAGFVSAEDRMALAAARERIQWSSLSLMARRQILPQHIDGHLFSYRPWMAVCDVVPRAPGATTQGHDTSLEGLSRLASLARRHRVAMVVRILLNRGRHPPDLLELPGMGRAAEAAQAVVFLHREVLMEDTASVGKADARVVRVGGREVEPRIVPLRFDQRFAGLLEL